MTLYVLEGFSRAAEFGVDLPDPADQIIESAWQWATQEYLREFRQRALERNCCWESVTISTTSSRATSSTAAKSSRTASRRSGSPLRNEPACSSSPFRDWKDHSPRLKALLALTLHRAERTDDATLVFDSILDSARTDDQLGTYWAPEDRSWLWYNDTIESHAFILRAMIEMRPDSPMRAGLVQWLLLNKKLNHWKSTRATAEVLYALAHYFKSEGTLGIDERATATLGQQTHEFLWEADSYTGKKKPDRSPR